MQDHVQFVRLYKVWLSVSALIILKHASVQCLVSDAVEGTVVICDSCLPPPPLPAHYDFQCIVSVRLIRSHFNNLFVYKLACIPICLTAMSTDF